MKPDRKAKAFFALVSLILLGIYYNGASSSHSTYIPKNELEGNYNKFIGGRIGLVGNVVGVGESSFTLLTKYSDGKTVKKITFIIMQRTDAAVGDVANVDGTLGEGYKVFPIKIMIYEKQKYRFIFIRSILGPLFLAFMLFRSWKFDIKEKRFAER